MEGNYRRGVLIPVPRGRPAGNADPSARPRHARCLALFAELEVALAPLYPAKSHRGYRDVPLFPTACGELKRMYVRPAYSGLGLARHLLVHLERYARVLDTALETRVHQEVAIALYERIGYQPIPLSSDYRPDPLSRFYEKRIA